MSQSSGRVEHRVETTRATRLMDGFLPIGDKCSGRNHEWTETIDQYRPNGFLWLKAADQTTKRFDGVDIHCPLG